MSRVSQAWLLALGIASLLFWSVPPSHAQSVTEPPEAGSEADAEDQGRFSPFRSEIQRLRERLNILPQRGQSESVDPEAARMQAEELGAELSPPENAVQVAQSSDTGIRIGALENQIRLLTGQIEDLQFRVQQLEAQLASGATAVGTTAQNAAPSQSSVQVNLRNQPQSALPQQAPVPNLPPPPPGQGQGQLAGQGSTALGAPPQPLGQLTVDQGTQLGSQPGLNALGGQPFNLNAQDSFGTQVPAIAGQQQAGLTTAPPSDDPRDHYDLAYGFFLRGEYDTARNAFGAFLSRFPQDGLAGNATYWIGETHYQQQNYADAARNFLDTSERHASSPKAPDAMLRLGQSLGRLNQRDAACSTFSELQRRYPQAQGDVNSQARQAAQGLGC
jgi:tol-pal system protein YbgF